MLSLKVPSIHGFSLGAITCNRGRVRVRDQYLFEAREEDRMGGSNRREGRGWERRAEMIIVQNHDE